jgi:hypothetical protein
MSWGTLAADACAVRAADRAKRAASIVPTAEVAMSIARNVGYAAVSHALDAAYREEQREKEAVIERIASARANVAAAAEAIGSGAQLSAAQAQACAQLAVEPAGPGRGNVRQALGSLEGSQASLRAAGQALKTAAEALDDAAAASGDSAGDLMRICTLALTDAANAIKSGAKPGLDAALLAIQAALVQAPRVCKEDLRRAQSALQTALEFVAVTIDYAIEQALHTARITTHSLGSAFPQTVKNAQHEIRQSAAQRGSFAAQLVQAFQRAEESFSDAPLAAPVLRQRMHTSAAADSPAAQARSTLRELKYRGCMLGTAFVAQGSDCLALAAKQVTQLVCAPLAGVSEELEREIAAQEAAGQAELSERRQILVQRQRLAQQTADSLHQAAGALRVAREEIQSKLRPVVDAALNAVPAQQSDAGQTAAADPIALAGKTEAQLAPVAAAHVSGVLAQSASALQSAFATLATLRFDLAQSQPATQFGGASDATAMPTPPVIGQVEKALGKPIEQLLQAGDEACRRATAALTRRAGAVA